MKLVMIRVEPISELLFRIPLRIITMFIYDAKVNRKDNYEYSIWNSAVTTKSLKTILKLDKNLAEGNFPKFIKYIIKLHGNNLLLKL